MGNKFNIENYDDPDLQRLYLKDIDCPDAWRESLRRILPPFLFYLNEFIDERDNGSPLYRGLAPAGDLMSSLAPKHRAENLMCYIGHEGTYTPAHREMCATLGHNIMVDASDGGPDPWGQPQKPGSSIWFMTQSKDRAVVSEYWLSVLGHDIEVESHFAQINAWKHAPFATFIVEQRVGDFILIPPLAPHQVWNCGTRTMKVAWNRTTVDTLDMAINEALPRTRMVCRDEQYKTKAIVFFTLAKYAERLERLETYRIHYDAAVLDTLETSRNLQQLRKDFSRLLQLFREILKSEAFAPEMPAPEDVQFLEYDSFVTCSFCRCNIFNRFLTCPTCVEEVDGEEPDTYDVCMECFTMGRSCGCISGQRWVEQFRWTDLTACYEKWRTMVLKMDSRYVQGGDLREFKEVIHSRRKKTLAQVCQEQLTLRPWHDITQPRLTAVEEKEVANGRKPGENNKDKDDDDGKKASTRRRKSKDAVDDDMPEHPHCHACRHRQLHWKMVVCRCGTAYCYGVLFRAYEQLPISIMEDPDWRCPRCLNMCSCAHCVKRTRTQPYMPTGTIVGHDTRHVADPRSVQSLVDFRKSNMFWIEKLRQEELHSKTSYRNSRLAHFQAEAERLKAQPIDLDAVYVDDTGINIAKSFGLVDSDDDDTGYSSSPSDANGAVGGEGDGVEDGGASTGYNSATLIHTTDLLLPSQSA